MFKVTIDVDVLKEVLETILFEAYGDNGLEMLNVVLDEIENIKEG